LCGLKGAHRKSKSKRKRCKRKWQAQAMQEAGGQRGRQTLTAGGGEGGAPIFQLLINLNKRTRHHASLTITHPPHHLHNSFHHLLRWLLLEPLPTAGTAAAARVVAALFLPVSHVTRHSSHTTHNSLNAARYRPDITRHASRTCHASTRAEAPPPSLPKCYVPKPLWNMFHNGYGWWRWIVMRPSCITVLASSSARL
jgi:hypothetical protein